MGHIWKGISTLWLTSVTKIWMRGEAEGDILACKGILKYMDFWLSYNMIKPSRNRLLLPRFHCDKLDDEIWLSGGSYL